MIEINILELLAVPSLITVVITPANLPAPLQPRYSCLCSVRVSTFYMKDIIIIILLQLIQTNTNYKNKQIKLSVERLKLQSSDLLH